MRFVAFKYFKRNEKRNRSALEGLVRFIWRPIDLYQECHSRIQIVHHPFEHKMARLDEYMIGGKTDCSTFVFCFLILFAGYMFIPAPTTHPSFDKDGRYIMHKSSYGPVEPGPGLFPSIIGNCSLTFYTAVGEPDQPNTAYLNCRAVVTLTDHCGEYCSFGDYQYKIVPPPK